MANRGPVNVVTGAFGYTGRYITALLLQRGFRVRTLTAHPNRANLFGDRVEVAPFNLIIPMRSRVASKVLTQCSTLIG
jgi:NADH dehydrogenase